LKKWVLHTLGQRIEFARIMDKDGNPLERCNEFLAVLLAPQIYGEAWSDNVELLAEELLNCPAQDLVPVACFFLSNQTTMRLFGVAW
jgi:hypothetical protein